MKIIAADDEKLALESLISSIRKCCPDDDIAGFNNPKELLEFVGREKCDIAFLDIKMSGINGVEVARRMKLANNNVNIIFVTGYDNYTGNAMQLHASGYILKPVTPKKIQKELSDLRYIPSESERIMLKVRCFGNFEVYISDGTAVRFDRTKAKEIFAYLIYRQGASCSVKEIAARIFEDNTYDKRQQTYIQQIISSMMKTLRQYDAEDTVIKTYNSLSINTGCIDCDFYDFVNSGISSAGVYKGEFMAQYSWAEYMNGYLERLSRINKSDDTTK